jgi:hypothetical protein
MRSRGAVRSRASSSFILGSLAWSSPYIRISPYSYSPYTIFIRFIAAVRTVCASVLATPRANTKATVQPEPSLSADVAGGERSPGADVAAVEYRMANVRPEWCHDSPSHTVAYGRST